MERALKIIGRDKMLISELEVNSKGNAVKVPHSMNKASGKISNSRKAFSDTNFGAATRGYMKSINRLDESILQDVWRRTKEIAARRRGAPPTVEDDSEDERALIFDTWYCPFLSLSSVPTDGFRCYFLFYRVRYLYCPFLSSFTVHTIISVPCLFVHCCPPSHSRRRLHVLHVAIRFVAHVKCLVFATYQYFHIAFSPFCLA